MRKPVPVLLSLRSLPFYSLYSSLFLVSPLTPHILPRLDPLPQSLTLSPQTLPPKPPTSKGICGAIFSRGFYITHYWIHELYIWQPCIFMRDISFMPRAGNARGLRVENNTLIPCIMYEAPSISPHEHVYISRKLTCGENIYRSGLCVMAGLGYWCIRVREDEGNLVFVNAFWTSYAS